MSIPAMRANFAPAAPPDRAPVLFLLSSLGMGGSEGKSVRMANCLAARGMRITIAYLGPPDQRLGEVSPDVEVVHLHRRGKFSFGALNRLVDLIRRLGTPVVVSLNLYASLYAAAARWRLGRARFRLVTSLNTTDVRAGTTTWQMPLYRWVLRQPDFIIFGAEAQRALWRKRYGIGRDDSTAVLYNGVDTDRFHVSSIRNASLPTKYVIGTVGGLRPEKAHLDLIAATAALRKLGIDVGALIVGDGPERSRLTAAIEQHALGEVVRLVGEARDVRPHLTAMDLFVLSSTAVETFSNAALEALACGVPVVCSRIGGMEELIGFGGGVSYAAGDVAGLTDVLANLLPDATLRKRLSRAARQAAVEHFGWDRMLERFLDLAQRGGTS